MADGQDLQQTSREERKHRVLSQGTPSIVSSIAEAVVVKAGNPFLLTQRDGSIPLDDGHGFGLYCRDCRYLSGYEVRLAGAPPDEIACTAALGTSAIFELTNPDIRMPDGALLQRHTLSITWRRAIDADDNALRETMTFTNRSLQRVDVPLELAFAAGFEDVYEVRGLVSARRGDHLPPSWQDGELRFAYRGRDGLHRGATVAFDPPPDEMGTATARFHIVLEPDEVREIAISVLLAEAEELADVCPVPSVARREATVSESADRWFAGWHTQQMEVDSSSLLLTSVIERSMRDLGMLRTRINGDDFFAAGVPWFVTLFGRDSAVTAIQTLAFDRRIADETLRLLAHYQGRRVDDLHDEAPGKILHELRVGELARLNEIPQTPYYGTVDATPLFLILLARQAAWSGSLDLFHELRGAVDAALDWVEHYGAIEDGGYLVYRSGTGEGLANQGWKDSGDAIVTADGDIATPPIAVVEAQGYAYQALQEIAPLFRRAGEEARAAELLAEADALRERLNRDFWLEDRQFFALALQGDGAPCAVISSNPGHLLWSGVLDVARARAVADRLLRDDMFNGWGIRTLSTEERRYNPIGYHLGTVWPHDNAIIADGFRRYGFADEADRLFDALVQAATHFEDYRLPEVFAGYEREEYHVPVRYPVACHPQAWAAGTLPYMLQSALGLVPEGFDRRLRIVRPRLPGFVDRLMLRGLRVGDAVADIRFEREDGAVQVRVERVEGDLDVRVEQDVPVGQGARSD
ncbi:MAG: glycogen debranching N-terminal domain-containing protein [Dehalococcoidia bacterium]